MAKIRIQMACPAREHEQLKAAIEAGALKVLAAGNYIMGEEIALFEKEAAAYLGTRGSIGVSSGTDALLVPLMALGAGPGSEVVTTAFSFVATSSTIARTGATPVFVDIEEGGFNLDPARLDAAISPRARAIIVVHLFGQPARMDEIMKVARARGVPVVEDTAQSFGALYRGKMAGTIGDWGCYSFFPAKVLGAAGDAGLVTCAAESDEKAARMLRVQGASGKNVHPLLGGNFRLDTLQAAVLRAKLPALDGWLEGRRRHAARYAEKLAPLGDRLVLPREQEGTRSVWAQYVVRTPRREALREFLNERGIAAEVYYPLPLPWQECMAKATGQRAGDGFPVTARACAEVLAIPVHPLLTAAEIDETADTIVEFFTKHD